MDLNNQESSLGHERQLHNINHIEQEFTKNGPSKIELVKQSHGPTPFLLKLMTAVLRYSQVHVRVIWDFLTVTDTAQNKMYFDCRRMHGFVSRGFTGDMAPVSKVSWCCGKRSFIMIQVRSSAGTKVGTESVWTCSTGSLPSLDPFISGVAPLTNKPLNRTN